MSHEHRQHPERYYDDEGEAYPDYDWLRGVARISGPGIVIDDEGRIAPMNEVPDYGDPADWPILDLPTFYDRDADVD